MNNIKDLRKAKGLTQDQLAEKIPVSRAALSTWETGLYEPDLKTLKKLAEIFQTSIDNILGEKDENLVIITKDEFAILQEAKQIIEKIESENPEIKNSFKIEDNHGTINIGNKKGE